MSYSLCCIYLNVFLFTVINSDLPDLYNGAFNQINHDAVEWKIAKSVISSKNNNVS